MKILVDAMGGDNAPYAMVRASINIVKDYNDVNITLLGKKDLIENELQGFKSPNITIENASEVITNDDIPTIAIKKKKDSSLVKGFKMIKDKEADAIVSAGNTGAFLSGATLITGRINKILRPALAVTLPTDKGCTLLLDAGANANCKPENLKQFAIMGSIYMQKLMEIERPRVGLINIGTEEGKGNELVKLSYDIIKNSGNINFMGNIEARQIPLGDADVVVCDGFVGNILLKFMEGMGVTVFRNVKSIFTRNFLTYLSALFVKKGLKEFKNKFDYKEYGGAPLLGIDGTVIKAHGNCDEKAFYVTLKQTVKFVRTGIIDEIKHEILNKEG